METAQTIREIRENVETVIRGKPRAVELAMIGLLAGGHVLIEDVPGVGKTMLARALARSIQGGFRRIQFTPDLLPSDILGVSIYRETCAEFEFQPGPIFANVLLADEINRATPRTQSSLLEAMNDRQVTVDGKTYPLEPPFIVLATQNPIEIAGTYPLPESQLDRFLIRIRMGYPSAEAERAVLEDQKQVHPIESLKPVATLRSVTALQDAVREVKVEGAVAQYVVALAEASRKSRRLLLGASPRASLALYRAAQALALLRDRDYVLPDDVKKLAISVLAHRLIEKDTFEKGTSRKGEQVVREILESVPVPL
ncbi:MAG: AAA family ATPase [Planctomycetota bacterium]